MKFSGVATMHAPADRVWTALTDPAVLLVTIPGCERLEPGDPGSYRFAAQAKVASIEGSYTGEVSVSQQQEPSSFVLTMSGVGAPGAVSTSVRVRLAEQAGGTTELSYDADAVVGGLIAGVGQRMLCSVAKRMAGEFFSSVDGVVAGPAPVSTEVVSPVLANAVAPPAGPPAKPPAKPTIGPLAEPAAAPAPPTLVPAAPGRAAPVLDTQFPAAFARGVLVGAAGTLAGVALAGLIGRKAR